MEKKSSRKSHLMVGPIGCGVELGGRIIMLLQWQVLNECDALRVVEESHQSLQGFFNNFFYLHSILFRLFHSITS